MSQKRWEFTGETKIVYGREVKQIRACISFGKVSAGDVGGWLEDENSLPQDGEGWLFNLSVAFKSSVIRGGVISGGVILGGVIRGDVSKSPIFIAGIKWSVTVCDSVMSIGCQTHSIGEWKKFTKKQIAEMSNDANEFWGKYKKIIFTMIDDRDGGKE